MTKNEFKALRKRLGHNIASFSRVTGIQRDMISRIEKGKKELTPEIVAQVRKTLGFESEKQKAELQVSIDYLKLTFFNAKVEEIIENVLGIESRHFTTEGCKRYKYSMKHSCGSIILMSSTDMAQGVLLDLTSQGVRQFEECLEIEGITLVQWLKRVLDPTFYLTKEYYNRIHSTRIDLAIDEMYDGVNGNFDLKVLQKKQREGLIKTDLQLYKEIGGRKRNEEQGTTLSWGARSSDSCYIRMYEKRFELAKELNVDVESILENQRIWNRYELEIGKGRTSYVLEHYLKGEPLIEIAVDMLLSEIEVYDELHENGVKVACKEFYDIFGHWKQVTVVNQTEQKRLAKSAHWILTQVVPTLKMLSEVFGKEQVLGWLSYCIDMTPLQPEQRKQVAFERMMLSQGKEESTLLSFIGDCEGWGCESCGRT